MTRAIGGRSVINCDVKPKSTEHVSNGSAHTVSLLTACAQGIV